MKYFSFEFDNEQDLQAVKQQLWEKMGVTGELGTVNLGGGRWRLEVYSEKDLRESSLEKFKQFRREAAGAVTEGAEEVEE